MPQSLRDRVVRLAYTREGPLRSHLLRVVRASALPPDVLKIIHDYRGTLAKGYVPRVFKKYVELHPLAGSCNGVSCQLASEINKVLGEDRARVVGGWFRKTGPDYYYPREYGLNDEWPPSNVEKKPGESWQEHWWVELDGYYIDVTSDQFFPSDVKEQASHRVVVQPKSDADSAYYPIRRRPLGGENRPLPSNLESLATKIVSMKQSRQWSVSEYDKRGLWKFETWLRANDSKYGLSEQEVADLLATMKHEAVAVDMTDIEQVREILREVV